ncbi:hypothetical protein AB4254_08375, partial [Vibrio breoganii]
RLFLVIIGTIMLMFIGDFFVLAVFSLGKRVIRGREKKWVDLLTRDSKRTAVRCITAAVLSTPIWLFLFQGI